MNSISGTLAPAGCEEVPDPLRLLVITGSPGDVGRVDQALRDAGLPAEVVGCGRLAEGLDALRHRPFDLILLDPGDRGVVAVRQVESAAPAVPVILLVPAESLDSAIQALRRGADDYLVRESLTPERLLCALRHALTVKRGEAALARLEHLGREIGESLHEGVLLIDRRGMTVFASARMGEILGSPAAGVMGVSFLSFVDPADVPRAKALIAQGRDGRAEAGLRLRRSDGGVIDARLTASRVTGEGGEYRGLAIGVTDITAQRRAEEELRRRNVQLNVINQLVRTATSAAGTEELFADTLDRALTLLGFEGGAIYLIGHDGGRAELVAEAGLPEGFSFRQQIADLNLPPYDGVIGRGVPRFVEDYPRAYPADAGAGIRALASIPIIAGKRVIGVVNLVSQSAHAFSPGEQEVLASIGREIGSAVGLMRLHETANFYLDLMTHDINNANTAALGYAAILLEELRGPEQELAKRVAAAVMQSAEIVANVSTLRRLAEEAPAPGPVNLDPAIRSAAGMFLDADIRYTPEALWVAADDLLVAVFANLIGNAVKFGGPGVLVRITAREEDGTVTVSVEDTGPGIPDAEKPLVFEKFRKGGKKSGKGLGLYIVRTLVERYGGRIWVEDRIPGRPEEGAAFRLVFRACPPVTGREG